MSDYVDLKTVSDVIDYLSMFDGDMPVRHEYDGNCGGLSVTIRGVSIEEDTDILGRDFKREFFSDGSSPVSFAAIVF